MQFEIEAEIQDQLSFLDTVVSRHTNNAYPEINTKVKPTDKGLFYYFNSFIPDAYKNNLIYCLISRMYRIASSYGRGPHETQEQIPKKRLLITLVRFYC